MVTTGQGGFVVSGKSINSLQDRCVLTSLGGTRDRSVLERVYG